MLFNFIPNSYKFIFLISLATLLTSSFALTKRNCPSSWRDPNIRCPTQPNLVCAYFSGGNCDSDLCAKQVLTPCSACQDPLVKFFTDGYCELDKVYCDDNSRSFFPPYCYLEGTVCGFYKQGCPVEICALEMDSSCTACRDPKILYYKLGTCDVQDKVNECQPDQCSKSEYPAKYQIYNPVCAFRANCVGRNCAKTFNNECTACTTRGYTQFKNGICDQDRTDCATTNRALNCRNEKKSPVCAYFTVLESPIGTLVGRAPADNSCSACLDTTVKYFTRGSCTSLDQRTYCPVYQRPTSCSRSNDVVCGYTPDDSNFVPYQEFRNSCEACKDSNVVYHEPGPCPILCTGNEGADGYDNACSGSKVDPVCVPYYDSTGKRRFMSVKNNCVACVDLNIGSNSYFKGLCSGADRALQCANEVPSYYYGSIYPVCGYLKENCQSSSCRMTFAEPIMACSYPAVSYLPGVCPGDQGISCDIYRNRKEICEDKKTLTNRVCGYTKKNCTGSSCRKTYQNQCYACDNRSVLYFVKGSC